MLFKRAIPALGGGAMPKAVRKHRAQQASDFGGKAVKGTPFFCINYRKCPIRTRFVVKY